MKRIFLIVLICILLLGCAIALISCGNPTEDVQEAEARLEEKGYVVVTFPTGGKVGIDRSFTATKYDDDLNEVVEWIQIFYVNETVDGIYDYVRGLFDEEKEQDSNKDKNVEFGKKEGVIWFGTPNAIIDANL